MMMEDEPWHSWHASDLVREQAMKTYLHGKHQLDSAPSVCMRLLGSLGSGGRCDWELSADAKAKDSLHNDEHEHSGMGAVPR